MRLPVPELFEGGREDRAGVVVVEVGTTAVAAEGDEVVVSCSSVTLETCRHPVRVRFCGVCGYG